jgi:hypothetical protein
VSVKRPSWRVRCALSGAANNIDHLDIGADFFVAAGESAGSQFSSDVMREMQQDIAADDLVGIDIIDALCRWILQAGQPGRRASIGPHTILGDKSSETAKVIFTTLSLILAEIELAPLDERALTHTVRAVRIPHCRDWQALGSNARGLAQS